MLGGRQNYGAVTIVSKGPAEEQDLFDALITTALERRSAIERRASRV
jgi:hypothetical protein